MRMGAHISISGGLCRALYDAHHIGCSTLQLFSGSSVCWMLDFIPYKDCIVDEWTELLKKFNLDDLMVHASFLINLATSNPVVWSKSIKALRSEIQRCQQLKIKYLVLHPGFYRDSLREIGHKNLFNGICEVVDLLQHPDSPLLLIENLAGQGTAICSDVLEFTNVVKKLRTLVNIGICIDTCHLFAYGYDIRLKSQLDNVVNIIDKELGIDYVKALHVNDTYSLLGSKKDRHANIGKGKLGINCFENIMNHDKLKGINKYLETPGNLGVWKVELELLYGLLDEFEHKDGLIY